MNTTYSPAEIIWQQIPLGVKMSLGVREQCKRNNDKSLVMKVGANNSRLQVWITLNSHDLYDIVLLKGITRHKERNTVDDAWLCEGVRKVWTRHDIFAEMLGEVLLRMESENWG
jgi:mRNA-degrading endonuclease HigB of HigAB toxin-antitoxin module